MWLVWGMDALLAEVLEDVPVVAPEAEPDVAPVVEPAIAPDVTPALAAASIAS